MNTGQLFDGTLRYLHRKAELNSRPDVSLKTAAAALIKAVADIPQPAAITLVQYHLEWLTSLEEAVHDLSSAMDRDAEAPLVSGDAAIGERLSNAMGRLHNIRSAANVPEHKQNDTEFLRATAVICKEQAEAALIEATP